MSKFIYNYTVISDEANSIFANDLPTRSLARAELKEIKALGYKDAKILREEYLLITTRQVR